MKTLKNFVERLAIGIKKIFFIDKNAENRQNYRIVKERITTPGNESELFRTEEYIRSYTGMTRWQTV